MAPIIYFLLLLLLIPYSLLAKNAKHISSSISVVGVVYCDTCSTNRFSRHSYFLPGVDVHIQCTFKANAPKTAEQMNFSINGTTDGYGTYKLEIPHVDGIDCVDGSAIQSQCQASLIRSSSPACDVLGLEATTNQISIKSKQDDHCIYSLNALSYRPAEKNATLCEQELPGSFNSSKFFLPYFPPFPWPYPLPQFPPLHFPPLPPYPSLPFPPLSSLPFPRFPFPFSSPPSLPFPFPPISYSSPPSLPFPFPPLPPFPPTPSLFQPPPPPAFNLGDPRTWIPHIPSLSSPPPPPAFNLRDPRTWIPYHPPSPPSTPQNHNP